MPTTYREVQTALRTAQRKAAAFMTAGKPRLAALWMQQATALRMRLRTMAAPQP
jgi:hypothetical protein